MQKFRACCQEHKCSFDRTVIVPGFSAIVGRRAATTTQPEVSALFAWTRRNRVVVARILGHRLANIRMRREKFAQFRMLLGVAVVVYQRRLVRKRARDIRMLTRERAPGLEL